MRRLIRPRAALGHFAARARDAGIRGVAAPCRISAVAVTLAAAAAALVPRSAAADVFVDFGITASHVEAKIADPAGAVKSTSTDAGLHLGLGARKSINEKSDIGVRLELDSIESETLLALRAFDYRRHRSDRLAFNYFIGAARYSLATPAYGYYLGFGVQLKDFVSGLDLGLDLRYGDKIARDNLLPSDPEGGSPDNFYDITGVTLYLSHRF